MANPALSANRQLWHTCYHANLQAAIATAPEDFVFHPDESAGVADLMTAALAKGKANINTKAIKATCMALSIPHRRAAIAAFLNGKG